MAMQGSVSCRGLPSHTAISGEREACMAIDMARKALQFRSFVTIGFSGADGSLLFTTLCEKNLLLSVHMEKTEQTFRGAAA